MATNSRTDLPLRAHQTSRLCVFVAACLMAVESAARFDVSQLETNMVGEQVIMFAQLKADRGLYVIVGGVTPDGDRQLKLFPPTSTGYGPKPVVSVSVPEDVVLIDIGRFAGQDGIVFFTRERAILFDPFVESVQELLRFESLYNNPVDEKLPARDMMRDLDSDGLDDFVIPAFAGYLVSLQRPDKTFPQPTMLNAPAVMSLTYEGHPWYQPRKLFHADFDLDGRKDLGVWMEDSLRFYRATGNGSFNASFSELPMVMRFDFDGVESMSAGMRDADQSDLTARVLYDLDDLDGDGIPDLVALTVRSEGVFKKQSTHGIHLGRRSAEGQLYFQTSPDSVIESSGIQFEMFHRDLDADGDRDIGVSSVQLGVGKIIGALLTGSIDIDLDFFSMQDRRYPARPDASREITASFNLASGDVFFPFVLLADIDGDGRTELLAQEGDEALLIYPGEPGGRLFARQAERITLPLPNDEDLVEVADLDRDGRMDVIMRLETRGEVSSVQVLLAQPD